MELAKSEMRTQSNITVGLHFLLAYYIQNGTMGLIFFSNSVDAELMLARHGAVTLNDH